MLSRSLSFSLLSNNINSTVKQLTVLINQTVNDDDDDTTTATDDTLTCIHFFIELHT